MVTKDLGFVIKRYNFRDTSVIASIFTLNHGRITGILKGFYTNKKEFSSSLDIGTLNEFMFYPKKQEVWLVSYVDLVSQYPYLHSNLTKAHVAGIFFHAIDKTMQIWDTSQEVFFLLKDSLELLKQHDSNKMLYIFLIKFLTLSGFKPELNRCICCHKKLPEKVFFSVSKGGFVGDCCQIKITDAQAINNEVSSSLFYIQQNEITQCLRLNPTVHCSREILKILARFFVFHLEWDIFARLPRQ